jgi:hypothetical protein
VTLPGFSIRILIAIVCLSSLELAVGRALSDHHIVDCWAGFVLIGLAVQVGLFRLVHGPVEARWFWTAFIASGLLAALSFLEWKRVHELGTASESLVSAAWLEYLSLVDDYLCNILVSGFTVRDGRHASTFEAIIAGLQSFQVEIVIFLPQLLAALLGGWLARFTAWVIKLFCGASHHERSLRVTPN